jgi:hypothetical protein
MSLSMWKIKLRAKAPLYVPDEEVKWKRDKI